MKCPYCNEEMVKGYIQCRDGVDWTEKKQVIAALSALGKGRTSLANGAAEDNSAVYAYKCEKCKKVIIDYENLIKKIYRMLKAGGNLVFTVEHPVFTAHGTQDWYYNEKGEILHFPVDNYYYEGKRTAMFLEEKVTKYHRTLTTYLNTLLSNSFIINQIVEPQPPENMMDIPGMADEMRRPMMLIVSAKKKM